MNINLPNSRQAVLAEYSKQIVPEYRKNPLIEALPDIFSKENVVDLLTTYPVYDPKERLLSVEYRYHCVMRITRYFQPWKKHYDLESRFSRAIRQGYIARDPLGRNYALQLQQGYQAIKNQKYAGVFNPESYTTSSGFTIIGISGGGKTKAIDHVLSPYPKIIVHSEYMEQPLSIYQIPWLKLECPFDGSLKGLCINFFMKIDELLGTNYYEKYGSGRNLSVNTMLPRMAQIASLHCVGVLIIDEIQHLSLQKSGGAEKMLNFFVNLVNTIGIPVVMVGTYKAGRVLQDAFRQARRGSGQGDMTWDRLDNDEVWDLLMTGMMTYQWTKKTIPCNDEIKNTLYEESQGILDIGVKLFMMAQLRAISTGIETVDSKMIRMIARDNLKLVKPMLDALKSGIMKDIEKYDDIKPLNIADFFEKNIPAPNFEDIRRKKLDEEKQLRLEGRSKIEQVIIKLLNLDVDEKLALKVTEEVLCSELNGETNINVIVKEVYRRILLEEGLKNTGNPISLEEKRKRKKQVVVKEKPLLRIIVEKGREDKKSAYESLKEAGYIQVLLRQT